MISVVANENIYTRQFWLLCVPILIAAMATIMTSMLVVATADTSAQLIAGITLYGLAQGATSPTLLAWATDPGNDQHRGRGIASLHTCMELGIGPGALCSGLIYGNQPGNFPNSFAICSSLAFTALVFLLALKKCKAA